MVREIQELSYSACLALGIFRSYTKGAMNFHQAQGLRNVDLAARE